MIISVKGYYKDRPDTIFTQPCKIGLDFQEDDDFFYYFTEGEVICEDKGEFVFTEWRFA